MLGSWDPMARHHGRRSRRQPGPRRFTAVLRAHRRPRRSHAIRPIVSPWTFAVRRHSARRHRHRCRHQRRQLRHHRGTDTRMLPRGRPCSIRRRSGNNLPAAISVSRNSRRSRRTRRRKCRLSLGCRRKVPRPPNRLGRDGRCRLWSVHTRPRPESNRRARVLFHQPRLGEGARARVRLPLRFPGVHWMHSARR